MDEMRCLVLILLLVSFVRSGRLSKEENLAIQTECSRRLFRRILNADPVAAHDVIGQSAVAIVVEGPNKGVCSGTLISPRHVLTASHCFTQHECTSTKPKTVVHVGAQCIDKPSCSGTAIGVRKYTTFPGYFPSECKGETKVGLDITVVELEQDVRNGLTTIACLPKSAEIPREMTGYGFGDNNSNLGNLGMLKWKPINCTNEEDKAVFCAQPYKFEQNGCFGDSGHGALQIGAGSRPIIHGVFSNGASCDQIVNMIILKEKGKKIKPRESAERFVATHDKSEFICQHSGLCP